MIQPPSLKKNDVIGIAAPGRRLDAATVQAAATIIESWGYQIRLGKNLFSEKHSYLSGADAERLEDLQTMLNDSTVHAIVCARGGYGTSRIIDQLNFNAFIKKPKWVCGFSDITSLHLKLQTLGIQSIHSTMPVLFSNPESVSSTQSLRKILTGETVSLSADAHPQNKNGKGSGLLVGGNLSLITDSLGTSSEVDTENKILVIEEIDEHLYKIDRMMVQLKRAQKLNKLAGLAVGHMTSLKETDLPFGETFENIILNHVKEFNYPVGFNFLTGHENPNIAWVQGGERTLNVSQEKSTITFS